jgi:hypothetical protein
VLFNYQQRISTFSYYYFLSGKDLYNDGTEAKYNENERRRRYQRITERKALTSYIPYTTLP